MIQDGPIGIIPRALSHLFDELRAMEMEFTMRVSYLELYNEELCDLLSTDDTIKIRIFDDSTKKGSVIVQGLEEIPVHNKDDVYKLLAKGQERRKTASTLMNAHSSRSHTVFSILVHIKENGIDGEEMLKIGKLNLVDLAGSENISKAGNEKGVRARETVNINQSLLTLGRVITALVERTPHVPYRESKLTRLLQESLGGRTKTSIIATISPGHKDLEETLSTLDYAHRAKNIQNKPEINQRMLKTVVLKEYTEEIDKLKRDLIAAREKNGVYLDEQTHTEMVYKIESSNKEMTEMKDRIRMLKDELSKQISLFNEVSYNLVQQNEELDKLGKKLTQTEKELELKKRNLRKAKYRYEEKKAIITQHMKSEELLTKQAKDLIKTAEMASSDTEKLHQTIERRKEVEKKLETSYDAFAGLLQEKLNEMNKSLVNFTDDLTKQSKTIHQEINNATKVHNNLSNEFQTIQESLKSFRQAAAEDRKRIIESCFLKIDQNLVHDQKKIMSLLAATLEEDRNQQAEINSLNDQIWQAQAKANEDLILKQNSLALQVKKQNEMINVFNANLSHQLQKIRDETTPFYSHQKQIHEAINASQFINSAQKQLQEKMQVQFAEFMSQLNSNVERFDYNFKNITTEVDKMSACNTSVADQLATCISNIKTHHEEAEKQEQSHEGVVQQINETMAEIQKKNSEDKLTLYNSLTKYSSSIAEKVKTTSSEFENMIGNVKSQNKENQIELVDFDTEKNQEHCTREQQLQNQYELCKTCVTNSSINCKSLLEQAEKFLNQYDKETKTLITKTSDDVENFRKNEVKTYLPSGVTPERKKYRIERDLASTSPHDRIIRQFRMEYNKGADLDSSTMVSEVSLI